MSRTSRSKRGEEFAQLPLRAIESEAWRWLPHFARVVLIAFAGQFRGFNNGALELTVESAKKRGISKQEMYAAIALLILAGFLKRTVNARRRDGQGQPAKYALTWRALPEIPRFNITATLHPSNEWQKFVAPFPAVSSLREAMRAVGQAEPAGSKRLDKLKARRTHPDSQRVDDTRHPETDALRAHASSEEGDTRHLNSQPERDTRHPTEKREQA